MEEKYGYSPQLYENDTSTFNYEVFLKVVLLELESTINQVELPTGLTIQMKNQDFHPLECIGCMECKSSLVQGQMKNGSVKIYSPWTHCVDHRPVVCQTKLGACLNLQWQDEQMLRTGQEPENVVIDLIMGFPFGDSNTMDIYKGVLTSISNEMPTGWRGVIDSRFHRDRVIPDDMEEMSKSGNFIGIKLMLWGPAPNYFLRPGQTVQVDKFENGKVREAYLVLKGLIKHFQLNVSSYLLKKILLGSSWNSCESLETREIVKSAMELPELQCELSQHFGSKYIMSNRFITFEGSVAKSRSFFARYIFRTEGLLQYAQDKFLDLSQGWIIWTLVFWLFAFGLLIILGE